MMLYYNLIRFLRLRLFFYSDAYVLRHTQDFLSYSITSDEKQARRIFQKILRLASSNDKLAIEVSSYKRFLKMQDQLSGRQQYQQFSSVNLADNEAENLPSFSWRKLSLVGIPSFAAISVFALAAFLHFGNFQVGRSSGEFSSTDGGSSALSSFYYTNGYFLSHPEYTVRGNLLVIDREIQQLLILGENDQLAELKKQWWQSALWSLKQKMQTRVKTILWRDYEIQLTGTSLLLSAEKDGRSVIGVLKGKVSIKPQNRLQHNSGGHANPKLNEQEYYSLTAGKQMTILPETATTRPGDTEPLQFKIEPLKNDYLEPLKFLSLKSISSRNTAANIELAKAVAKTDSSETGKLTVDSTKEETHVKKIENLPKPDLRLLMKDGTMMNCFLVDENENEYIVRVQGSTTIVKVAKGQVEKAIK